jgi:hypothetical protein
VLNLLSKYKWLAVLATAPLILPSCMSVPAMTMARLAPLSPLDADPAQIRIAILAPVDLVLRKGDAVMKVSWTPERGEAKNVSYNLDILVGNAAAPALIARAKPDQNINVLRLSDTDVENLAALQAEIRDAKAAKTRGKGSLTFGFVGGCWSGPFPRDGRAMPFEPFLQTETAGDFLPLFQGVDVKDLLKMAGVDSLPNCQDDTSRRKPVITTTRQPAR